MDEKVCRRWDNQAGRYDRSVTKTNSDRKTWDGWKKVYGNALEGCEGKLLDCGCGPGTVTMYVAGPKYRITALDQSQNMLEMAKKNTQAMSIEAEFVQGDAENLPFEDESFDVVVSQHMLWTVPDPQKVIDEWFRILKPGGKLVYTDGDWFNDPKKTRSRLMVSHFFTSFEYPRRETRKQRDERERMGDFAHLWSASAHRPADDVPMVSNSGFVDVDVINGLEKDVTHGISYWRYGYLYNYFMVTAIKPSESPEKNRFNYACY